MCQQGGTTKESLASRGSSLSFSTSINSENIGYTIWKDNSTVSFITTGSSTKSISLQRRIGSKITSIQAPTVVRVFNTNLNGIDKLDQTIHTPYNTEKVGRTKKPYRKIFFGILDVGTAAGYRVKRMKHGVAYTHQNFVENLQIQLLNMLKTEFFEGEFHPKTHVHGYERECSYCIYEMEKFGIVDLFRATRTYIWCIECQLFICKNHYSIAHTSEEFRKVKPTGQPFYKKRKLRHNQEN